MKILVTLFFAVVAMCGAPAPGSEIPSRQRSVPAVAPDTIPPWVLDPANLSTDPHRVTGTFVRNLVLVLFQPHTAQPQRQQAIEAVRGRVVGGRRSDGDGFYYVWIPGDTTAAPLLHATTVLRSFPQVHTAVLEMTSNAGFP